MFEAMTAAPASRRKKIFLGVSGVAHGAAITALIVSAMWRVDKLDREHQPATIVVAPPPPPGNSGGGRAHPLPKTPAKTPVKHRVTVPVQPVHMQVEQPTPAEPETPDTPGDGGGGDGKGSGPPTGGGGCTDGADCVGSETVIPHEKLPCSDPSRKDDADCKPIVQPPKIVVVQSLRISGETQIEPPDGVKIMMSHEGKAKLHATFKVCLDAGGNVTSTSAMSSSGYPAYDERLSAGIATWRYRPYSVDGKSIAVCGPVTFIYVMQ